MSEWPTYEQMVELMTREQLIAKVLNQRNEIIILQRIQRGHSKMLLDRFHKIEKAIRFLRHEQPAQALFVLTENMENAAGVLRELARGDGDGNA